MLGWPPAQFWAATLIEFTAAVAAYERIHGRGSARAKHRAFARFRREVEAAEAERRRARLAAGARAFSEGGLP